MNLTIPFGNVTDPGVSMITKVDLASGGTLTLMIHVIIFLLILGAYYKKSNNFEKGLVASGFITSVIGGFLTIIGYLSMKFVWISVVLFVMAFVVKGFERE